MNSKLWNSIKTIVNKNLGSVSYQAPTWWPEVKQKSIQHRKKLGIGAAVVFVVGGGVYGLKRYVDSLPQPDYLTFEITLPAPTNQIDKIPNKLLVHFNKSAAKMTDVGKVISAGIKMDPPLMGQWRWESDRLLTFQPEKGKADWGVKFDYTVKFEKSFFPDHLKPKEYSFDFSTEPLTFKMTSQELYVDPRNPKVKKVIVRIGFNYPVNTEDFKKHIKFNLKTEGVELTSKSVPFSVTFNQFSTEAYLQSEPLEVPKDKQTMLVEVSKGAKALAGGPGSESYENVPVEVPGLYDAFKYDDVTTSFARNQKYEPEQIVVVTTALEVRSQDIAKNLQLSLLPRNKKAEGERPEQKDYVWQSSSELTDDVRGESKAIKFDTLPTEKETSKVHTFIIKTDPKRSVLVHIAKGVKALGDYEQKDDFEKVVRIQAYPQELSIMGEGAILSLSGDLKIPMLGRNVPSVRYTLHRVLPSQVNHLLTMMNGDIKGIDLEYSELEQKISEKFEDTIQLKISSEWETQYFALDLAPYLSKASSQRGIFLLQSKAINANGSVGASDHRLIMVTDLGILVKETLSKNQIVFVQNYKTGTPVEGAEVEVIGRNSLAVLKAVTDSQGQASFPSLDDFKDEKYPIAFSVRKGQDQAYLPFKSYKQNIDYSRFDVGGAYDSSASDQLTSMIFSDRGIYRPGEEAHLGVMVRSQGGKKFQKVPLIWTVTNSKGQEILQEKITADSSQMLDLHFQTEETAPTGAYDIHMFIVKNGKMSDIIGSLTVKVEEFQPDRLKIHTNLEPGKSIGWIKPAKISAQIDLKNMFGTAAEHRRVKGDVTVTPLGSSFKAYRDYLFTNVNKPEEQIVTETLDETETNEKGEARFELDLNKYTANLFQVRFEAEGFESAGGRSVHATSEVLVSPLEFLVAAKPDGDLLYIKKDAERNINVIAIDSDLKKIAASDVSLQIVERKYVSVLTQQGDGNYKYQSVLKEFPLSSKPFKISAQGTKLKLDTAAAGDFTLVFKGKDQSELLKLNYSVVGVGNLTRSLEKNAELQLSLNKQDFRVGEEIEMQIKAPYKGAGLISIERNGVYATKWFKTQNTSTIEKIKIPPGLEGNAYINVTFLRAIDSAEIFASPLSYAIAPFSISLDDRRTDIKLGVPEKIKPGQKLKVSYSSNKKTQIILYGVDEGILQVAKYRLPNPLGYFFQKKALQVLTYQMWDLLLPEFSIVKASLAPGGDEGFQALGKNLNPFRNKRAKPVAFWSGVLTASPEVKTYSFDVPEYFNGNIKIMAVAASEASLGSQENQTLVRGDFILSPTTPVFVTPSDEFIVGVGVANQAEGTGAGAEVTVETRPSALFEVTDGAKQTVAIPEGHEGAVDVKVKALEKLGEGSLNFKASSGTFQGTNRVEISVRPAFPYTFNLQSGLIEKSPLELESHQSFYGEYYKGLMTLSAFPLVIGTGLANYLENYPYGCTEQLISKGVPALVMRTRPEFIPNPEKAKEFFQNVIQVLRTRQRPDGGFALYNPAHEQSNPVASLYAIQYLIEARDKKMAVPTEILKAAQSYLESPTVRSSSDLAGLRRWSYSLYLLARLGVVNGASLAELHRTLENNFKGTWEKDLVAVYMAGVYQLYKQDEAGEKLIHGFKIGESKTTEYEEYIDPTVRDSVIIYVVAKHFPMQLKNILSEVSYKQWLAPLSEGRYNSHSAAHILLAMEALGSNMGTQKDIEQWSVDIKMPGKDFASVTAAKKAPMQWNLPLNHEKLRARGEKTGTIFYAYSLAGFQKTESTKEIKNGLEISREFQTADGKPMSKISVGEEVTVVVRARSTDEKTHMNVAIVDLVPGGFEMVLEPVKENLENSGEPAVEGGDDQGAPEPGGEEGEPVEGDEGASLSPWFKWLAPNAAYAQTSQASIEDMIIDFADKRDDRVVLYSTITAEMRQYIYHIKAINQGQFNVPPTFAEGMYDRSLRFVGTSSKVTIEATKH